MAGKSSANRSTITPLSSKLAHLSNAPSKAASTRVRSSASNSRRRVTTGSAAGVVDGLEVAVESAVRDLVAQEVAVDHGLAEVDPVPDAAVEGVAVELVGAGEQPGRAGDRGCDLEVDVRPEEVGEAVGQRPRQAGVPLG